MNPIHKCVPGRWMTWGLAMAFIVTGASWSLATGADSDDPTRNPVRKIEEPPPTTYLLRALLTWGDEQERAVADAGGTVIFRHGASGIGVATSTSESFLETALLSGRFEGGSVDALVSWGSSPSAEELPSDPSASAALPDEIAANPNDETLINSQWPLTAIQAREAWDLGYEGQGVRVAVLDGGICASHVDLDASIDLAAGRSFVPGRHFADDGIGFRRACFLAGIIAAEDNATGVIGVAPRSTIVPCKVLHNGAGTFEALIEGILYASDPVSEGGAGAQIILVGSSTILSLDDPVNVEIAQSVTRAIKHAKQRNALVMVGAGDAAMDLDALDGIHVPAQCGALCVAAGGPLGYAVGWPNGATDFDRPAGYTNTGAHSLWVSGPGGDSALDPGLGLCSIPRVPTGTTRNPCYLFDGVVSTGYVSGTSSIFTWSVGTGAAAAHVAGVSALVVQRFPGLAAREVMAHIGRTAVDNYPGVDPQRGRGFVNALRAVTEPLDGPDIDGDAPEMGYASKRVAPTVTPGLGLAISPNPVREGASFTITMAEAGAARLELFDIAGRSITLLLDGQAPAGATLLKWDGKGRNGRLVAAGAYFAKLQAAGSTVRRMVVVAP